MASVRKRKWTHNGEEREAWVVNYTDQSGKRRLKTFDKKKDADRYRTQVETEIEAGIHTPSYGAMTLADLAELWVKDQQRRNTIGEITGATLYGYTCKAKRMITSRPIGRTRITDLTSLQIQHFIDEMSTQWSRGTCVEIRMILKYVLTFGVRRKLIKRNILIDEPVSVPKMKKDRPYISSVEDLQALLKAASVRDPGEPMLIFLNRMVVLCLGVFAGLRGGEMIGLQWEDIDFDNNVLNIRHSFSAFDGLKSPKSFAGIREIPMSWPIRHALIRVADYWTNHERIVQAPDRAVTRGRAQVKLNVLVERNQVLPGTPPVMSGHVLKNYFGGPLEPTNINLQYFRPLLKKAGLMREGGPRLRLHLLRHAAASLFIRAGLQPLQLKRIVGHTSIQTTFDVYGHLFDDDDSARQASEAIVSRLAPALPSLPAPAPEGGVSGRDKVAT